MSDAAAFMQAIIRDPDDDGLRLMYSDWLEEHGDPARAEFIRLSVAYARQVAESAECDILHCRFRELEIQHRADWLRDLNLAMVQDGVYFEFRRGLVEIAYCEAAPDVFFAHLPHWFAATPLRVLSLNIGLDDKGMLRLAAVHELGRLHGLAIYSQEGHDTRVWAELFRSPGLKNLRTLIVRSCRLENEHVVELAQSPGLANLQTLDLSFNAFGVQAAQALVDSPHLTELKIVYASDSASGVEEEELNRVLQSRFEVRDCWI